MRSFFQRHETAAFLLLTFGISWPLWIASGTLRREPVRQPDSAWLLAQIGVFAPAFAGMILAAFLEEKMGRRARRTLLCVYLPAVLLGLAVVIRSFDSFTRMGPGWTIAMAGLCIWVLVWFRHGENRLAAWPGSTVGGGTIAFWTAGVAVISVAAFVLAWVLARSSAAGAAVAVPPASLREPSIDGILGSLTVNLLFGGSLGEEPGWRGVWLPRLLRRHSPTKASLIIGFWWAAWHAPIDLAHGFGLAGTGALTLRLVWTIPIAVVFTWVTLRAAGSLLPAFAFHTALNMMPDFMLRDPARYERACAIFLAFALVTAIGAVFVDRRMTNRPVPAADDGRAQAP